MHRSNSHDEQDEPADPPPLDDCDPVRQREIADMEADAETSRWFSYVAVGIVLVSMILALLGVVGGVVYFLRS